MSLLLDNDIVYKLAQLDLLTDAKTLFSEMFGDLKVLDTLRFRFCHHDAKRREKIDKRYNAIVTRRIEQFIDSAEVKEISKEVCDSSLIEAMNLIDGLDAGEMQLLQSLIDEKEQLFFTGDKRFLKALVRAECLESRLVEIQEKFICFEQIISFLIHRFTFEQVKNSYINARNSEIAIDSALKVCFSEHNKVKVIQKLSIYIEDLRRETGNLLVTEIR